MVMCGGEIVLNNIKENKLTLEETKIRKRELEESLLTLIRNFEVDTGCYIKYINLEGYRIFADSEYISRTHQVELECHL